MSDFWLYLKLGLTHVLDWQAYDHIVFLIVLVAAYNFSNWKRIFILVSLFTIGHTTSLLLANYKVVAISSKWIEFLIPVTILVAALYNLLTSGKNNRSEKVGLFYVITIFFGFIHGFGFATYYKMITGGNEILPLFEFSLGIEFAQLIIVTIVLISSFIFQSIFRFNKRDWVLVVSSIVIGVVIPMLQNNWPL
ncbi:MAG: HupE/UreJ family protein [Flavobacteriaceae bacterium]|nr:HupE/UreJ family protein [Flavobacteriaceae bacterium]